ncbi:hypothetical protein FACS1894217_12000 [Clostridia bacterium]|nr:hypothetical protein FACS1894217_12000 [Clostridia bacterium]
MKKYDWIIIAITGAFICVTIGYFLGRVPAAGTFEISTLTIPSPPVVTVTVPVPSEVYVYITPSPTPEIPEISVTDDPEVLPTLEPTIEPPAPTATNPPAPKTAAPALGPVNINSADLQELQRLPGIGPAIAQRILDDRAANGLYRTVDELQRVKGIGEKMMEKLRPLIEI